MLRNVKGIPGSTANGTSRLLGVDEILLKTRCNPLTRAIGLAKKIKQPYVALKYWLEIASFVYPKATAKFDKAVSPVQSVKNAEQAQRLLSAIENNVKRQKKSLKDPHPTLLESEIEEKEQGRPLSDA